MSKKGVEDDETVERVCVELPNCTPAGVRANTSH